MAINLLDSAILSKIGSNEVSLYRCYDLGGRIFLTEYANDVVEGDKVYVSMGLSSSDSKTDAEGSKIGNTKIEGLVTKRINIASLTAIKGKAVKIILMTIDNVDSSRRFFYIGRSKVGIVTIEGGYKYSIELLSTLAASSKTNTEQISPSCTLSLGSDRCGVSMNLFKIQGVVTSVLNSKGIFTIGHAPITAIQPSNYYLGGRCVFHDADDLGNSGVIRGVEHAPGANPTNTDVFLAYPLQVSIRVGQSVTIFAGCDKRLNTCINKFNNQLRFLGAAALPGVAQRLRGV